MDPEPLTIDNEAEAKQYLTDLLRHRDFQSMDVIESRCAKLVPNPTVKAYFLAEGAKMLAKLKGQL
ncbi:hypothetical protein [Methylobacterium sp. 285MFTsu5.1]|uniref:hypothetical protein n=1 Tax=Methylobacterium sp. 285MFTsu5.1 TaxID=1172187 RepID=UPI00037ED930|nr:hypothetical protein [Methylobacterium sp. 285MFTsu5.1]